MFRLICWVTGGHTDELIQYGQGIAVYRCWKCTREECRALLKAERVGEKTNEVRN